MTLTLLERVSEWAEPEELRETWDKQEFVALEVWRSNWSKLQATAMASRRDDGENDGWVGWTDGFRRREGLSNTLSSLRLTFSGPIYTRNKQNKPDFIVYTNLN